MKPLWQELHEGLIDDIKQTMNHVKFWEDFIIRHIHDPADIDKEILCGLKEILKKQRKEYKLKYGSYPKPSQLKESK